MRDLNQVRSMDIVNELENLKKKFTFVLCVKHKAAPPFIVQYKQGLFLGNKFSDIPKIRKKFTNLRNFVKI